jgi:hypothetical protein
MITLLAMLHKSILQLKTNILCKKVENIQM